MAVSGSEEWTPRLLKDVMTRAGVDKRAGNSVDEILPGVFLGKRAVAEDVDLLHEMRVTHVLCCCSQEKDIWKMELKLKKAGIRYLGFPLTNFPFCDLDPCYQPAAQYMDKALQDQGKVLVHCNRGVSRSAALLIACVMIRHHVTVDEAVRLVRSRRFINPNNHFLQQLCTLNQQLREAGHFSEKADVPGVEQVTPEMKTDSSEVMS